MIAIEVDDDELKILAREISNIWDRENQLANQAMDEGREEDFEVHTKHLYRLGYRLTYFQSLLLPESERTP
jgi:hypothetical protein